MFAGRARTMATPSSEPWLTVRTSVAPHRSLDNEQPARGSHHGQGIDKDLLTRWMSNRAQTRMLTSWMARMTSWMAQDRRRGCHRVVVVTALHELRLLDGPNWC